MFVVFWCRYPRVRPNRASAVQGGLVRIWKFLGWAVGLMLTLGALLGVGVEFANDSPTSHLRGAIIIAASFAAYSLPAALLGLVVMSLLARGSRGPRRWGALAAAGACLLAVAAMSMRLGPLYFQDDGATSGRSLRVMSANASFGSTPAKDLMALVAQEQVDVLVIEEVTPSLLVDLDRSGISKALTYRAGEPEGSVRGTMVFAREPLERVQKLNVTNGAWSMRLGGGEKGITLVGVHTTPPLYGIKLWRQDLREVAAAVSQAKADGDTVLVAGDFNATIDHRAFREVLDAGLIDAADACGAGWQPTWPRPGTKHLPAWAPGTVLPIDHIMVTSGAGCSGFKTLHLAESDHRGVIATFVLP